jgi:ribosome-associated protein
MPDSAMSQSEPAQIPEDALEEMKRGKLPHNLQSRLGDATTFSFIASSGPGGQNVNKVATAVQLRCNVFKLGLSPPVYARLKELAGSRMTTAGEIVITARSYRTQEQNREDARARLSDLVAKAHIRQAKRIKTRVSKAAKAKRVEAKTQRGAVKQARAKPRLD